MAEYYTIITNIGKAKIANAQVLGRKLEFTHLIVGDGVGNPSESQTSLRSEVWRGHIGTIDIDSNNPNWIVIEAVVPSDVGGFNVREVGVIDADDDLIAIGKYPETYKPLLAEGTAKDLYLRMIIEVTNVASVQLKIDPTIAIPSRKWVDEEIEKAKAILIPKNIMGQPNGVATLDPDGKVPMEQLKDAATKQEVEDVQTEVAAHKADDATDAHFAKNIALEDIQNNFTSNNVEGALKELFTNVSNGKQLVGTAITDVDDSLVVPTNPTFQHLADLIGSISTGKKWAMGTAISDSTTHSYTNDATGSGSLVAYSIGVKGNDIDFEIGYAIIVSNDLQYVSVVKRKNDGTYCMYLGIMGGVLNRARLSIGSQPFGVRVSNTQVTWIAYEL